MYIKTTKSKNHTYVQLVQGYREKDKVRHKVLANLGRLDQLQKDKESWAVVAEKLAELIGATNIVNVNKCGDTEIKNWGYLLYKKLWRKFKLDRILGDLKDNSKLQFSLNNACFLMVIQHLLAPKSKLGTFNKQSGYFQLPEVGLNHLYRALDVMCEFKETIEQEMFKVNCEIFKMQVDVVFYDVTTFHFESVKNDTLKDFGFSKACKFNEVQVVLGMFIDAEGRPIGYELFSGNTFDSKTLDQALEAIEKRFGIRSVVIVADRGINSKLNLKHIADKGYKYIVSSRIKSMGKNIQEKIFEANGYSTLDNGGDDLLYKVLDYINVNIVGGEKFALPEKLIITYSTKRAHKDRSDRERLLNKANKLLQNKALIKSSSKRGGKKYLKEQGEIDWTLDNEAIAKDERFDGYYGIQTNDPDLSVDKVLSAYHTLWKIEESFRIMKSTLEVRPIFHWTEKRIKGHFVISFLAFLLERTMELTLRHAGIQASTSEIREAINAMNFTETSYSGKKYLFKTKLSELSRHMLKLMKLKNLSNSFPAEQFDIERFIM